MLVSSDLARQSASHVSTEITVDSQSSR